MISLVQLEYIVTLVTYRHFATAAEKCYVTQQTLSMQIKKLEDHLGIIIFDRSRQPVVPTEQGRQIIDQARIILQEAARIDQITSELKEQVAGELRIGLIPTISPFLLPLFAGRFKKAHPNIDLTVEEAITENIEDLLMKDQLDIGVVVTPLNNSNIIERPLYYEEMMIYHHPEHPFSEKQQIIVEKIEHGDLWLLGDGHCFRNQVVNFCEISKLETTSLPYKFEGGSINTLMKIIDREGGYTLIPELAVMENLNKNQLKSFANTRPLREVSLVYTRKYLRGLPSLVGPTAQLLAATVYIAPLALIVDRPFSKPLPSWGPIGAVLFLAVLGTGLAFVLYYRLIERASATFVSMVTYLVPVVGLALGVFILHERPGWNAYAGCVLILLGVMIVNGVFGLARRRIAAGLGVKP